MAISGSLFLPNQSFSAKLISPGPNCGTRKLFSVRASLGSSSSSSDGAEQKLIKKEKDGWKIEYTEEKPVTPLLDTVNYPIHMKNLSSQDLERLAAELRADIVHTVSKIGGHLSSSLGVVELTVALHHVFNTPEDKIIWDVGHQAYAHKILTGRRSAMHTIRKTSGLAGFPKREESVHDAFGAGHSSTSISAGLGMAVARDLLGKKNHVISVIGDGAMTAGMAYEAMNNAGFLDTNMIIVLNDNKQVSLPTATLDGPATPVGALSSTLAKIQASSEFRKLREAAKSFTKQMGGKTHEVAAKVDEYARGMLNATGSTLFEELGIYYIGPVDGHNLEDLVTIFDKVKATPAPGPVLIHIVTEKGKGYPPAEAAPDKMHGTVLEIGKGRILAEGSRVAILGYGAIVQQCMDAAKMLKTRDIEITVADARFCKPLDTELIRQLVNEHEILITVEEGAIGGFGSHVSQFLSLSGLLDGPLKLRSMVLPDRYIDHGSPQDQIEEAGLSSKQISATVLSLLGMPKEAFHLK
ncbi:hypothetical protein TIFTF001_004475 [Ficus carica]|uniref:Transketolase C-terminal domain-containing protein n=1 Tax=Ficus carica TaxID=3494 RepID=A0AA87ZGC2_FICCA|nr:hypothetical protein TIFTF001_004475 [Ficus carica]